jgi:prepilin signal peptidase PulO-like enzyme (type II secretory pathway)
VNALLAIPLEIRLALLFVLGAMLGRAVNAAVHGLALTPREHPRLPRRLGRLPIVGWWSNVPEARHWAVSWQRLLGVELACAGALPLLYWWETVQLGILIPATAWEFPLADPPIPFIALAHRQFLNHLLLGCFMLVASLIDFDETTIPDSVTVPGTLVGLLCVTAMPDSLLPNVTPLVQSMENQPCWLSAPNPLPGFLRGTPELGGLLVGWGCVWLWCLGLLPRAWRGSRGWSMAVRLILARTRRDPATPRVLLMGLGLSLVVGVLWFVGGVHWAGLLTSLVGLIGGGAMIWVVRIVGGGALQREAMGFGDVTLLGMIGAFIGWQACFIAFFVAPFFALLVALLKWLLRNQREIYFGPFLCLAASLVILRWAAIWDWLQGIFEIGWLVPATFLVCMLLTALMLVGWRLLLDFFLGQENSAA